MILPQGWNPFQTFLMSAAVLAGITGLFAKNESSQLVSRILPYWILSIWYSGLVIGGALALIGMFFSVKYRLLIKIAGISLLGGVGTGYTFIVAVAGHRPFAYPVLITGAFSLACIIRVIQLTKVLHNPDKSQEVIVE